MDEIEFQDINDIIYALCIAQTAYEFKLKEVIEKGYKESIDWYRNKLADIEKGFDATKKLREKLCLADDPIYRSKR